jgi:NADH-quinone oxidoreductase subunit L
MLDVVWLIPAFPLAGFLLILLFGRRLGEPKAGFLAAAMCGAAFVVTVGVFFDMLNNPAEDRSHITTLFSWVPVSSLQVDLAFLADPLSITMALFVTGIGTLIHLYAIGYMHGDPKFSKFFLYLNLFAFSMLMLVLGSNMLVTFLGWEGVGTCSYFLISFWHTRDSAATAGKKAFVTNRVGDWGFMMAMFFAFQAVGSLDYEFINNYAQTGRLSQNVGTAIAMFAFVGACGKSAQLPLYLWLPDAMEGPTPVSALIHAATMVTAGVYLMTRLNPVIAISSDTVGTVVAIVGIATALFAATIAVAQNDIKKVLAYSTVSQLGYMFLAIGSGAYVAAVFHMITHAFFKALLFLGSGSVIHGMHHEQDMRKMGALRKLMPVTAITFIIGWLAIAGVPPFAGFWSKDEILLFAYNKSPILYVLGLVTAILTAYYMTRQVIMTFFGEAKWKTADESRLALAAHGADAGDAHDAHADDAHAEEHNAHDSHGEHTPKESPVLMLLPLVVLAGLSIVGGFIQLPFSKSLHRLERWLEPVIAPGEVHLTEASEDLKYVLMGIAIVCALVGIGASYAVYAKKKVAAIEPEILAQGWKYDALVSGFMGGPGRKLFDGITAFDAKVVDGAVNGVGLGTQSVAGLIRKAQSGFVRVYALAISLGVIALLAWFVLKGIL